MGKADGLALAVSAPGRDRLAGLIAELEISEHFKEREMRIISDLVNIRSTK